jgi:hypothetical protein
MNTEVQQLGMLLVVPCRAAETAQDDAKKRLAESMAKIKKQLAKVGLRMMSTTRQCEI